MSTIHTVAIILMDRILPVQTFLQNLHEILLPSWTSLPSSSLIFKQSLRLFHYTFTHCNFQLFLYYACECPIIPELFSLIATCYSKNYAGILGSGLNLIEI